MIIIEGPLAGGHLGFGSEQLQHIDEMDYDTEIVSIIHKVEEYEKSFEKKIPVVIAGGIYERKDLEHACSLGASGVQIGTRFVTTFECDASQAYKEAYLQAEKKDILIVKSPVGMPGRAIRNKFVDRTQLGRIPHKGCYQCISGCDPATTPYCITDALINAVKGSVDQGLIFCGANAFRSHRLESVRDIMKEFDYREG